MGSKIATSRGRMGGDGLRVDVFLVGRRAHEGVLSNIHGVLAWSSRGVVVFVTGGAFQIHDILLWLRRIHFWLRACVTSSWPASLTCASAQGWLQSCSSTFTFTAVEI